MKYSTTDFFNALYNHDKANSKGLVHTFFINDKGQTYSNKRIPVKKWNELEPKNEKEELHINKYFSPNTFTNLKNENGKFTSTNKDVISLNALVIDLDCIKKGNITISKALKELEKEELRPNIVVSTGNGLQLYYLIETIPVFKNAAKTIKRYTETLSKMNLRFRNLGSDTATTSISNAFRFPNTLNVKEPSIINGLNYGGAREVEIINIDTKHIYTLRELTLHFDSDFKEWFENPKTEKKKENIVDFKKDKETKIASEYSKTLDLNNDRINDLIKLIDLRNGKVDSRNDFLRLTINLNKKRVNEVNSHFIKGKSENDIQSLLKYHSNISKEDKRKGYWTNAFIIQTLNITKEEQDQMKTIISKECALVRKNKRRATKKLLLDTVKDLKKYYVQRMINIKTNLELMNDLNLSKSTVQRYRKENLNISQINSNIMDLIISYDLQIENLQVENLTDSNLINFIFTLDTTLETKVA
ncbi:hypothetical protein [Vagococcus fluvialis]|uniref:hypothetical protein n=1 Tax=Vagococcus fluvialis TaxID=2738 RepID=UPI001D09B244|nr:hypothetical protein [Vagococcus fluvialis]UDM84069.1 hypothetical protein K5K96_15260 [Vagococcus fluvialis]